MKFGVVCGNDDKSIWSPTVSQSKSALQIEIATRDLEHSWAPMKISVANCGNELLQSRATRSVVDTVCQIELIWTMMPSLLVDAIYRRVPWDCGTLRLCRKSCAGEIYTGL